MSANRFTNQKNHDMISRNHFIMSHTHLLAYKAESFTVDWNNRMFTSIIKE